MVLLKREVSGTMFAVWLIGFTKHCTIANLATNLTSSFQDLTHVLLLCSYTDSSKGGSLNQHLDRMYLEYCEGGDLSVHLGRLDKDRVPIPEEYLWRMLECLSSACLMLQRGTIV